MYGRLLFCQPNRKYIEQREERSNQKYIKSEIYQSEIYEIGNISKYIFRELGDGRGWGGWGGVHS